MTGRYWRSCMHAVGRVILAFVTATFFASGYALVACDCPWRGPFLAVAPDLPLVVRARVLSFQGKGTAAGQPLSMDVEVLEVLRGEPPASPLRVWGDDGMLCRPYVTHFPVGTQWILALNGPGSKPGMTPGPAISICGEYWLRVEGDTAVGCIDSPERTAVQRIALAELRARLAAAAKAESDPPRARGRASFTGEVRAGDLFERRFGPCLEFRLEPTPLGWSVAVREPGREEDLSRLTPPFHFVPNPREIEGWHFRNSDNTGPNRAGAKNVNAPAENRTFIFSPEVGMTIAGPKATAAPSPADVEAVRRFGEGRLTILEYRLTGLQPNTRAAMAWMRFEVELSWSEDVAGSGASPQGSPLRDACLASLREARLSLDACFAALAPAIGAILDARGVTGLEAKPWREAWRSQAEDPCFRGFSLDFWGEGKAFDTPYRCVRCNVLCTHQVSVAASPPTFTLTGVWPDTRLDWYVNTGSSDADAAVGERIKALSPTCR